MGFLSDLVAARRRQLAASSLDESALRAAAEGVPPPRHLARRLRDAAAGDGVALIAEVKRASPSAGDIAADADPVSLATAYEEAGASAISVLTEPSHFKGSLADLRAVRAAVQHPVLCKDFLVHPIQLLEARAAGADSVLLIAAALPGDELAAMLEASRALGMEPLVETHSDEDVVRAVATDAQVIGVNARDLETLEVDPRTARTRLGEIPGDRVRVLESGIRGREDVLSAIAAGASAILVGETLMRAPDPRGVIEDLLGRDRLR